MHDIKLQKVSELPAFIIAALLRPNLNLCSTFWYLGPGPDKAVFLKLWTFKTVIDILLNFCTAVFSIIAYIVWWK